MSPGCVLTLKKAPDMNPKIKLKDSWILLDSPAVLIPVAGSMMIMMVNVQRIRKITHLRFELGHVGSARSPALRRLRACA